MRRDRHRDRARAARCRTAGTARSPKYTIAGGQQQRDQRRDPAQPGMALAAARELAALARLDRAWLALARAAEAAHPPGAGRDLGLVELLLGVELRIGRRRERLDRARRDARDLRLGERAPGPQPAAEPRRLGRRGGGRRARRAGRTARCRARGGRRVALRRVAVLAGAAWRRRGVGRRGSLPGQPPALALQPRRLALLRRCAASVSHGPRRDESIRGGPASSAAGGRRRASPRRPVHRRAAARRVVKRSSYSSTGIGSARSSPAANVRASRRLSRIAAGQRQRQPDHDPLARPSSAISSRRRARPAPGVGRGHAPAAASPARRWGR